MKFKTKPVEIEAYQWWPATTEDLFKWARSVSKNDETSLEYIRTNNSFLLNINTLEGKMKVSPGDYVICGLKGEFYACKPDVFKQKYELVKNESFDDDIPF